MQTKILVTGGSGMVGKHLQHYLPAAAFISSKQYDLRNTQDVEIMYRVYRPEIVVHLAAKVGGIMDNINNPVEFFEENILINTNTLHYAHKYGVKNFIGVLSTCIYPDRLSNDHYPLKEHLLHNGPPTATNFSYGYAKRCLAVLIDMYNKQYGTKYNYLIPTNLYSEHDHFFGDKAHFVSSLIHKIAVAKRTKSKEITLYGTGKPLRQFMYANDLARIIHRCIETSTYENFNVCGDENYSISDIANIALRACDATDIAIRWDMSKPDGQYRKDASNQLLKHYFPIFNFTSLEDGIKLTFNKHYNELAPK